MLSMPTDVSTQRKAGIEKLPLHVTTRFLRKDYGHMNIQATIDDPQAYTKPWGNSVDVTLLPEADLMEFICLENEKDTRRK